MSAGNTNPTDSPEASPTQPTSKKPNDTGAETTSLNLAKPSYLLAVLSFAIVAALVVGSAMYFTGRLTFGRPAAPVTTARTAQIEWRFHNDVPEATATSDLANEWRGARSDHKLIAHAVARCLHIDINTMSPDVFSMLMLDLRPNGDHYWKSEDASKEAGDFPKVSSYEGAVLAMSDAVARARLDAADGAGGFYPNMFWFGWATVAVSALATMLVTLRSSLSNHPLAAWIGTFAVLFSTTATVLTGAKQFWDPTNAYMRNETALLALRQLHNEIALSFVAAWDADRCEPIDSYDSEQKYKFQKWRNTLVSLQSGTMRAPVIVAVQNGIAGQYGNSSGEPNSNGGGGQTATPKRDTSGGQQTVHPATPPQRTSTQK